MLRHKIPKTERESLERQRRALEMGTMLFKLAKGAIKNDVGIENWMRASIVAYEEASK